MTFNFGPSDGLAGQINEGAPVDVFASASPTWMDAVQDDGPGVTGRVDFARNKLAIVVPAGNPAGIENLDDLAEPGVQLVLAAEGVPVGDYAREMLANAGISEAALANVVSNEEDVKAVITKVQSGRPTPASSTHRRHAHVAEELTVIPIPDDVKSWPTYPIAVVKDPRRPTSRGASSTTSSAPDSRSSTRRASSRTVRGAIPAGVVALAALGVALVPLPRLGSGDCGRRGLASSRSSQRDRARGAPRLAGRRSARGGDLVPPRVPLAGSRAQHLPRDRVVRALVVLPLVLPPVVAGVGLLAAFGRADGLLGCGCASDRHRAPFTTAGAALAAAFVSFPFVVLAVEAGLARSTAAGGRAASLGGSRWYVLRRVTSLLAPQIVAGAVLAWARALGEFGATITFAGNFAGETQTMPLAVFEAAANRHRGRVRRLSLV